ncbi:MAG: adhesin [Nitrospirae bacterium CG17_big_fil_post_rev_8_21_14_2_50_50_9]|nr:MAG: adhesin [Nitrospirae bacterium CG17_big_fil_post_rev_8_21_14_2_50_50_9]
MGLLPNHENAYVDSAKIRNYVLSASHPIGRFKAAYFRGLGYTHEKWKQFEDDIREQHLTLEAEPTEKTKYGQKYTIKGFVKCPNGKRVLLQSIWIILEGENTPRFVTIYPEGG